MSRYIEIHRNKSLRLDNVLIKDVLEMPFIRENERRDAALSIEREVDKMVDEIKMKGANQVGPLVQYSCTSSEENGFEIKIALMLQADRLINNTQPPYRMVPVIHLKNCLYTRFTGMEEDMQLAYQKMQVAAYEEDIKLKGSTYTVFLGSNDDGTITVDIFMEQTDE